MDASTLQPRKTMLDSDIDSVLSRFSANPAEVPFSSPTDVEEQTVARSLRSQALIKLNSARIKLHRYRAFQDVPIFTRRHCDLDQADESTPRQVGCSCHATLPSVTPHSSPHSTHSGSSSNASSQPSHTFSSSSCPDTMSSATKDIPFHDPAAARTCLKAALAIGRAFDSVPYPNPMQLPLPVEPPSMLSITSPTQAPRTMPSFACCAMQSCYTLLTLCYRSREVQCTNQRSVAADKGLEELYAGVGRVLKALQNYAIAFEALNGMTGESFVSTIAELQADLI